MFNEFHAAGKRSPKVTPADSTGLLRKRDQATGPISVNLRHVDARRDFATGINVPMNK